MDACIAHTYMYDMYVHALCMYCEYYLCLCIERVLFMYVCVYVLSVYVCIVCLCVCIACICVCMCVLCV